VRENKALLDGSSRAEGLQSSGNAKLLLAAQQTTQTLEQIGWVAAFTGEEGLQLAA
jgi:hypothetical protein